MSNQSGDIADVIIVGGGIIGCAIALELASEGRYDSIFLCERGRYLGDGTSTRNCYVIHAGIYYEHDSLKARFCVEGNRDTYAFCRRYGVDCLETGKLIVASRAEEIPRLEALQKRGTANGAPSLEILDAAEIRKLEPNIRALAALHSPSTGVFDVGQCFRVIEGLLFERGVTVLKSTKVIGVEPSKGAFRVVTDSRGEVGSRVLVNAAGLFSDEIANMLGADRRIHPCRGDYFTLAESKSGLVNRAVYPVPETHGLGVHLTKLTDGTVLVGPDARFVDDKDDYSDLPVFDESGDLDTRSEHVLRFFESARELLPMLEPDDLKLAHCGIRPKLAPAGESGFQDFIIEHDHHHPGAIHCLGIESPGLTAAFPIGRYVAGLVREIER